MTHPPPFASTGRRAARAAARGGRARRRRRRRRRGRGRRRHGGGERAAAPRVLLRREPRLRQRARRAIDRVREGIVAVTRARARGAGSPSARAAKARRAVLDSRDEASSSRPRALSSLILLAARTRGSRDDRRDRLDDFWVSSFLLSSFRLLSRTVVPLAIDTHTRTHFLQP